MNRSHRSYPYLVSLLCAFFVIVADASPALDSHESAIVAWSETHNEEAVDLLERLVNINSGSLNH